jgi:hypothetical protein
MTERVPLRFDTTSCSIAHLCSDEIRIIQNSEQQPTLQHVSLDLQKQDVKSDNTQLQSGGLFQCYLADWGNSICTVRDSNKHKVLQAIQSQLIRALENFHYSNLQSTLLSLSRLQKAILTKEKTFQTSLL